MLYCKQNIGGIRLIYEVMKSQIRARIWQDNNKTKKNWGIHRMFPGSFVFECSCDQKDRYD